MSAETYDPERHDRYEVRLRYHDVAVFDTLSEARALFDAEACDRCLTSGGESLRHCAIVDRYTDEMIRAVRVYSGRDVVFSAYAMPCEGCGTEFFDADGRDTLCIECAAAVPA